MEGHQRKSDVPEMRKEAWLRSLEARIEEIVASGSVPEIQVVKVNGSDIPVCIGCGNVLFEKNPKITRWCDRCARLREVIKERLRRRDGIC